jgi:hypothetical protein
MLFAFPYMGSENYVDHYVPRKSTNDIRFLVSSNVWGIVFGLDIYTCLVSINVTAQCPGGLATFNTSMYIRQSDYVGNNGK